MVVASYFQNSYSLVILSITGLENILKTKKLYKRPGRDSNPGRRSDSPPYWTGLYNANNCISILPGHFKFIVLQNQLKCFDYYSNYYCFFKDELLIKIISFINF